jgi:hypothetical protein
MVKVSFLFKLFLYQRCFFLMHVLFWKVLQLYKRYAVKPDTGDINMINHESQTRGSG